MEKSVKFHMGIIVQFSKTFLRRQGMKKRSNGMVRGLLTGIVLILTATILSGCSDSELEQKNSRLQSELTRTNAYNVQLGSKIEELIHKNQNYEKDLSALRDNNKNLGVSLAKSELVFSKKHKAELEAEIKKLNDEREAFRQEKQKIKKEAYEDAEASVKYKYLWILGVIFIVMIIFIVLFFAGMKKKKEEIKKLEEDNKKSEEEKEKYRVKAGEFSKIIEDLERKQQEGSINQVASEIKMADKRRKELLESLKGEENGN